MMKLLDKTFEPLTGELDGVGCARLAHAVINDSLLSPSYPSINRKDYRRVLKDLVEQSKIGIEFGKSSELIAHFCDVYNLDEKRVRDAVVRRATKTLLVASQRLNKYKSL